MIVIGLVSQVRWMKASPPTCHVYGSLKIVRCFLDIGSSCHLVVPQILGRLLCGALSVPHQAALLIVHLLKMCYFSPRVLLGFPNAVQSNQIHPRERDGVNHLLADLLAPGLTFALRPVPAHLLLVQNSFQNTLA